MKAKPWNEMSEKERARVEKQVRASNDAVDAARIKEYGEVGRNPNSAAYIGALLAKQSAAYTAIHPRDTRGRFTSKRQRRLRLVA